MRDIINCNEDNVLECERNTRGAQKGTFCAVY